MGVGRDNEKRKGRENPSFDLLGLRTPTRSKQQERGPVEEREAHMIAGYSS